MSPPLPQRDSMAGQRTDDCNLGVTMSDSAVPSNDCYRSVKREHPRDNELSGWSFAGTGAGGGGGGDGLFSRSSLSAPPSGVGSFDSSNALGAMLDGRRGGGGVIRGGRRGVGGSEEREPRAYKSDPDGGHQLQQDWGHRRMHVLPHPESSSAIGGVGGGGLKVSSAAGGGSALSRVEGDHIAAARWRQQQQSSDAERASLDGERWRSGGRQYLHGDKFGGSVGKGDGGGGGIVVDTARDLLAEATGRNHSAWDASEDVSPRTVLISHRGDHDSVSHGGGDRPQPWGIDSGVDGSIPVSERHVLGGIGAGDGSSAGRGGGDDVGGHGGDGQRGGGGDGWEFNANASVPVGVANGSIIGGVGDAGVVGGDSDSGGSDMGGAGLASPSQSAGGVWTGDTLVLPSPPSSPTRKASLQKTQQQHQHRRQSTVRLALASVQDYAQQRRSSGPTSSLVRVDDGNGRGSPFLGGSSPPFRGGLGSSSIPAPLESFRSSSSPPWPGAQQQHAPASGRYTAPPQSEEGCFHSPTLGSATPGMWGGNGGGGGGGGNGGASSSFLDVSGQSTTVVRDREYSVKGGLSGGWQQQGWGGGGAAHRSRGGGFEREGAWPSEYSL